MVGISRTASLTVCQDCSGLKGRHTDAEKKKAAGWFSIGSHVLLPLTPRARHMERHMERCHSEQYGEDFLHSSKACQGRGFKLSYWNVSVKSEPSTCFPGRLLEGSELRPCRFLMRRVASLEATVHSQPRVLALPSSSRVGSVAEPLRQDSSPSPTSSVPQSSSP